MSVGAILGVLAVVAGVIDLEQALRHAGGGEARADEQCDGVICQWTSE